MIRHKKFRGVKMDQKYPIVEIFHSVQGEGFHTGVPHVFVRFGNCNLRCEWCDTDFLTYNEMELSEIVSEVLSYECDRVIFTGGEPCLQDLDTIGNELKKHNIKLSVETNGTIPVPEVIDWICVSPKDQLYPNLSIKQRIGHELKVVYCGQDLSIYDDLKQGFEHHFSVVHGEIVDQLVDLCRLLKIEPIVLR